VNGSRAAWLVSLPVALAGCLAAHVVAYAVAPPAAASHATHRYLEHLPVVGGAALAVVLGAAIWHALRGRTGSRPSPWLFALLPPLAFALQEHLERLAQPVLLAADPTFLLGLALQLPFGLLAWLLAHAILRAADALGARLASPPRPRVTVALRLAPVAVAAPSRTFAPGAPLRGPPVVSRPRS
jgi:hypothetical protein